MATRHRQDWEPDAETAEFLAEIKEVLYGEELRDFWPVTLRGVHYAMFGQIDSYENTTKNYKRLGRVLTLARLSGKIPWSAIADNHREIMEHGGGFASIEDFVDFSRKDFLTGYHRNLGETQDVVLEIWVEKDTIARYVDEVAQEYGVTVVVARGYGSVSFVDDLRDRVCENTADGKKSLILYFGDLDPSGINMLEAMFTTLHNEMEVSEDEVTYERCAINPEQVKRYNLAPNPDALKDDAWQAKQRAAGDTEKTKGDPRAEAYKKEYGRVAVELDALGPRRLQTLVRSSIEQHLDMALFEKERKREAADNKKIEALRNRVMKLIDKELE